MHLNTILIAEEKKGKEVEISGIAETRKSMTRRDCRL